jgi:hypothetical protein
MQEGCRKALSCRGIFGCLGWIVALLTMLVAWVALYLNSQDDKRDVRRDELLKLFYEKCPLGTKMEVALEFLRTLPGGVVGPEPVSELTDSYSSSEIPYRYEEFHLFRASGGWYIAYYEVCSRIFYLEVRVYLFFDKDGKLVRKVFIP